MGRYKTYLPEFLVTSSAFRKVSVEVDSLIWVSSTDRSLQNDHVYLEVSFWYLIPNQFCSNKYATSTHPVTNMYYNKYQKNSNHFTFRHVKVRVKLVKITHNRKRKKTWWPPVQYQKKNKKKEVRILSLLRTSDHGSLRTKSRNHGIFLLL